MAESRVWVISMICCPEDIGGMSRRQAQQQQQQQQQQQNQAPMSIVERERSVLDARAGGLVEGLLLAMSMWRVAAMGCAAEQP